MQIWRGLESVAEPFEASTLAIGVFDGIHVGHQALIRAAVEDGRQNRRRSAVLTFDRHPSELLAPEKVPGYLTTDSQRARLFEELGVDDLVIARFDERFRELSPEAFLRFVVCGVMGARAVFVGSDFRFGKNQAGDTDYLNSAPTRCDFEVQVMQPVMVDGQKASSSRIRELLREGDVKRAARILGRPYAFVGTVVEGQSLGRKLGFPTANLETADKMVVPADGIYAVWTRRGHERHMGACSIGMRPTVGGTARTVEVFLIDFSGDLYGEELESEFIARLRKELKFDSVEEMVQQIGLDVEEAGQLLSNPDGVIQL